MTHHDVSLPLPSDLVATLHGLALDRDECFEDLVRGMLDREVMRLRSARASVRAREQQVARLQHLLAPDMLRAIGWADLQSRLALYGVELRPGAGALMLHDHITGERLCSSDALGFAYPALMRRLGGPLPDELCAVPAA
jgi:hypothetical protein